MLVAGDAWSAAARYDVEVPFRGMRPGVLDVGRERHGRALVQRRVGDVDIVKRELRADAGIEHGLFRHGLAPGGLRGCGRAGEERSECAAVKHGDTSRAFGSMVARMGGRRMTIWRTPRNIPAGQSRAGSTRAERFREDAMVCRFVLASVVAMIAASPAVEAQQAPKVYNTAKQKLLDGKQVVGGTVFSPDPNMYCATANAGFDFLWIEMQHSPLTYQDVARMIFACRGAAGMPFIRVPDATEGDIQKATDIGALGIIVPTVDTVEKAEAAVKWSKYP